MRKATRNQLGYTLLELITVILIVAILVTIIIFFITDFNQAG